LLITAGAGLICGVGCQSAGLRLLSLVGLRQKPLSVALVIDRPETAAQAINPFPAYGLFQKALAEHLGRPVAVDVCFGFQVEPAFSTGWYDLAVLSPMQFAMLKAAREAHVIAVSVDMQGRSARPALLVVPADSELTAASDLRGKSVAFGPVGDARTTRAALLCLAREGVQQDDLTLELLPTPGSLKHLPDARAVVRAVISREVAAGFLDQAAWEALPEHDDREAEPARDKLRIIARTVALPDRLLVASPKLDPVTVQQIRRFALEVGREHPEVIQPLACSGYCVPTEALLCACRSLTEVGGSGVVSGGQGGGDR